MSAVPDYVLELRDRLKAEHEAKQVVLGLAREQMEAREWARVPNEYRVLALMMAGIDGDLDALADRPWRAVPVPERIAIRSAMRESMLAYRGMVAVHGLPRACR